MANPLPFTPANVDPRVELQRRIEAAPLQHGEALLVAWDLLETAHRQGVLDLLNGAVGARDTIFGTLTRYAKEPEGVASIRNLISLITILGKIDPDTLASLAKGLGEAMTEQQRETRPPGWFRLVARLVGPDSRRAVSFLTFMLLGIGRSLREPRPSH